MTVQRNKELVVAALEVTCAVAELIRDVGRIPSGELYVLLMGKLSIENYQRLIESLISTGLVRRERSHMLVWIGPGGAR